jgi:hypothetical protein
MACRVNPGRANVEFPSAVARLPPLRHTQSLRGWPDGGIPDAPAGHLVYRPRIRADCPGRRWLWLAPFPLSAMPWRGPSPNPPTFRSCCSAHRCCWPAWRCWPVTCRPGAPPGSIPCRRCAGSEPIHRPWRICLAQYRWGGAQGLSPPWSPSQRRHRVDPRRPERRKPRGNQRHHAQEPCGEHKGQRIGRVHAE